MAYEKCIFTVDDQIFNKSAVLKAAFNFIDKYYIHLAYASEHDIEIELTSKNTHISQNVEKEFSNELIAQMLHYQISIDNKSVRELILGRALYSTCIDEKEETNTSASLPNPPAYSLDNIAVSWFGENNGRS